MTTTSQHQWFKSSYSGGSGTECVECALTDNSTLVRDSKRPDGDRVAVQGAAWVNFLQALNSGALGNAAAER